MRFGDKVVIVTGGAAGIGKAISMAFAWEGAQVGIWDLNGEAASQLATEICQRRGGEGQGLVS